MKIYEENNSKHYESKLLITILNLLCLASSATFNYCATRRLRKEGFTTQSRFWMAMNVHSRREIRIREHSCTHLTVNWIWCNISIVQQYVVYRNLWFIDMNDDWEYNLSENYVNNNCCEVNHSPVSKKVKAGTLSKRLNTN